VALEQDRTRPSSRPPVRFGWAVLLIVLCAAGLRAGYVLSVTRYDNGFYDAVFYRFEAISVADGRGFVVPLPGALGGQAAADHPPLTSLVLVPAAKLTRGAFWMRITMLLLGLAVVALVALLGRELGGPRVGLVAGGLAAVYPNLWMNDGLLMSETLAALTSVAALVLAYRLLRRPSVGVALGLGATCALAALTREELVLLVALLALPAAWLATPDRRVRLRISAGVVGAAVVVSAPWVVFNLTRYDDPTFFSTGDGIALLGSYCARSYHAPAIGFWNLKCIPVPQAPGDQSVVSQDYRERAIKYAAHHLGDLPVVVATRLGRMLGVYNPGQLARYNSGEGRPEWASLLGVATFLLLLPFAVWGGIWLRRRRRGRVWPLLAPVWLVLASTAFVYGTPRFRAPAEPVVVVLAAVGVMALLARRWPRLAPRVAEVEAPAPAA
jgi:4-amino-4-deoxy-L-arabinose transferase-like glycosyltransferase